MPLEQQSSPRSWLILSWNGPRSKCHRRSSIKSTRRCTSMDHWWRRASTQGWSSCHPLGYAWGTWFVFISPHQIMWPNMKHSSTAYASPSSWASNGLMFGVTSTVAVTERATSTVAVNEKSIWKLTEKPRFVYCCIRIRSELISEWCTAFRWSDKTQV